MGGQKIQCITHMPITQIPRRNAASKHRPVIFFRITYQPCILFGEKQFIGSRSSVARRVFGGSTLDFEELFDHGIFTGLCEVESRCVSIMLCVFAESFETGISG